MNNVVNRAPVAENIFERLTSGYPQGDVSAPTGGR